MPICPSCARDVLAGTGFCGYRGASLTGSVPGAIPPPADAPSAACWTCARCSVENDIANAFCLACGSFRVESAASPVAMPPALPTNATSRQCATCGQTNDLAAELCYYGGVAAALGGGEPAVAARREQACGGRTEPPRRILVGPAGGGRLQSTAPRARASPPRAQHRPPPE